MQWFKVPEKIYFEAGSIAYLEKMPNISRAFIVTDPSMTKLGYVDKDIFIMFYYKQKKIKDIARIFKISETKVKVILHRVRKSIKKNLKERGYNYGK